MSETEGSREIAAPIDTATMRAAFVQAQAQIMNNGTFEPVVVISKPLALSLLDEIERLRDDVARVLTRCDAFADTQGELPETYEYIDYLRTARRTGKTFDDDRYVEVDE